MPSIQVYVDSTGNTVTSPHILPFHIYFDQASHSTNPVYFKSLAARFSSANDLPTKIDITTSNLAQEHNHNTIIFPMTHTSSPSPSFHYHSDMHLGNVSNQNRITGYLTIHGNNVVQLPSQLSMVWFIDSKYM